MSAAGDDVTSLSATGPAFAGAAGFTTTHGSVVLEAGGESPAAQEALENLCRTYWRPIYGFVRRQGTRPEEAKDITQGFFALILEPKDFQSVRQEKGRLRSFLLASLKHFMANERVMPRRSNVAGRTVAIYDPNGVLITSLCAESVGTRFEL